MALPASITKFIYSPENLARLARDREMYLIFNGQVRDTIKRAILSEFKKIETVRELLNRVIPINITQKIVNKLAKLYSEDAIRKSKDDAPADAEVIETWSDPMSLQETWKEVNKYFKLSKRAAIEAFIDEDGIPRARCIYSHQYTQYSDSRITPNVPTETVKHLEMSSNDRRDHRHVVWSKTRHYLMDGYGRVIEEDGVNEYGAIPIIEVKEGSDLAPIQDDDLYWMQVAICLLLTDLSFASKYQGWSMLVLYGMESKQVTFNPNAVITIPNNKDGTQGKVDVVQPKVDTEGLLRQVECLVGLLLTTKNLSVNNISIRLESSSDAASGVAKILDQAESTEDRQDQISKFKIAEEQFLNTLAIQQRVWIENGELSPEYFDILSDGFKASVELPNQKIKASEKETVETEDMKLKGGLTTQFKALQKVHPDLDEKQIKQLQIEIIEERKMVRELQNGVESGTKDQSTETLNQGNDQQKSDTTIDTGSAKE